MSSERVSAKSAEWRDRFVRFEKWDRTVIEFCRSEGVSQPSFYQWRKKLGLKNASRVLNRSVTGSVAPEQILGNFRPFALTHPVIGASPKMRLPGGIELDLGSEPELVQAIVKQLVESSVSLSGQQSC